MREKKCKMERRKLESGITLIALIITVVILILVAGISISQISGDGLVSRTLSAREQAEIQGEKETIQAAVVQAKARNRYGKLTKDELQDELGDTDYTITEEDDMYIITLAQTKRSYLLDKKGKISERGKWGVDYSTGRISINGEEVKSGDVYLEIGDTIVGYDPTDGATENEVISYGESTTAHPSANGYADTVFRLVGAAEDDEETEEDDTLVSYDLSKGWKLLGVTTEGNLMITTADVVYPVSGGYDDNGVLRYPLYGRTGYKYAIEELDKISNLYGQGNMAISSRSMKMEDLNKITGYNPNDTDGNGTKHGTGTVSEYGAKITYYWNNSGTPYYTCSVSDDITDTLYYAHRPFYYWDGNDWQEVYYTNNGSEKIVELTNTAWEDRTAYDNKCTAKEKRLITVSDYYLLASRYFMASQKYAQFVIATVNPWSQIQISNIAYSHSNEGTQGKTRMMVRPVIILDSNINIKYTNGVWTISALS